MPREANILLSSSIRRLIRAGRTQQLRNVVNRSHPADLAHLFSSLTPDQRLTVFELIEERSNRGELVAELESEVLLELLRPLDDAVIAEMLKAMPPDDAIDILQDVDDERKDALLEMMTLEDHSEATTLLEYDEESAGGLMSPDFLALHESTTAGEAVARIQGGETAEIVFYIYITNDLGQLVGVTSLRELVQQSSDNPLGEFMITDIIRVQSDDDQEDVARLVARYNLLALPVVEDNNRLVGVVTVDDIIDVIRLEATEDMLLMAGAGDESEVSPHRSPFVSAKSRIPWLFPSFIAGAIGVGVVSSYEQELTAVLPLAALIPMIMGLAGNIGTQSSTIVTRGLALGSFDFVVSGRVVLKELLVGALAGLIYGCVIGGFSVAFFFGNEEVFGAGTLKFGGAIGASVLGSMTLAATIGAALPLVFQRLSLDPALALGPFVSTSIDVGAIALYLAIASVLLF